MKGRLRLPYVLTACLVFTLAVAMPLIASAEVIEEWVSRYNGPADGDDSAVAIAIDSLGNVYVTGMSEGDYATVKYDSHGNELWVKRYNGPGNRAEGTLEVGMGYWILLNKPQPYVMEGTDITEYTLSVEDGWYMIGGCSMPAQKMVTSGSGSIEVIYGYTQYVGYTRIPGSQPLGRGKGYWILFSNTSAGAKFTASTSVSE